MADRNGSIRKRCVKPRRLVVQGTLAVMHDSNAV